jgi:uncharacterized membrane protein YoaK (UPF0700 family)
MGVLDKLGGQIGYPEYSKAPYAEHSSKTPNPIPPEAVWGGGIGLGLVGLYAAGKIIKGIRRGPAVAPQRRSGMAKGTGLSLERVSTRLGELLPGRNTMVLVLTWTASGVDAISYLGLGHVFTANMTGNTVLLGLAIGQGQGLAALRSMVALAGFMAGVAGCALVLEAGQHRGEWPVSVTKAIFAEGVVLGVFTLTWHLGVHSGVTIYALIGLSAIAMGIQSAAIRHLKVPGIATTYITGTLTSMVAEFISWLYRWQLSPLAVDPTGQSATLDVPGSRRHQGARLQAAVLLIYVFAAVVSAFLQARNSSFVAYSPLLAVVLVVLNAYVRHRREHARPV